MNIIKIKKWIENYWYHYKRYTIITLLVTFMVAIAVSTHTPVEKYDFNVMAAIPAGMSSSNLEKLKMAIEKYTDDVKGTTLKVGIKHAYLHKNVNIYTRKIEIRADAKSNFQQSVNIELLTDDTFIFISDKETLDYLKEKGAIDDLSSIFPAIIKEKPRYGILIDELPLIGDLRDFPAEEYYISFRHYSEEGAKNQSYKTRYEQSKLTMERILTGNEKNGD